MKFKITVIPKQKHKNFPVLPLWIFNCSSLGSYFFSSFFLIIRYDYSISAPDPLSLQTCIA